jgi:ABC-type sugar transport system substrate-binding protein
LIEARRYERLGVQVLYCPTERLGCDDVEKATELLSRKVDALIITPGNAEALTPVIDQAESQGTRVICVDTDAPSSRRSTVVCVDAEVSGGLAAELMAGFLPPDSEVLVVTGMLGIEDHARKTRAFCKTYSEAGASPDAIEVFEAHDDEEEAFQKCFALLSNRGSIAGIYVNTANCLPVCRAICAGGLSGRIKLITTDLFNAMVPYFEKGTISVSIHGRPLVQGEMAMRLVVDHIVNDTPLPRTHYLLPHVVMRSNFRRFREMRRTPAEATALTASVIQVDSTAG